MKRYLLILPLVFIIAVFALGQQFAGKPEAAALPKTEIEVEETFINIGVYASLSGNASEFGRMGQQGMRLAVEQINEKGGIAGREIRLIEFDDQTNPEVAEQAVRRMTESIDLHAVIGSHTSGNIVAAAPITEELGIIQIGLGTSSSWTNAGNRCLFRATGSSALYNEAIVQEIKGAGHQKIAVFYTDSSYASAGAQHISDLIAQEAGMRVVCTVKHDMEETDYTAQIARIRVSGAEAVILYTSTEYAGLQLRQLKNMGVYLPIYAPEGLSSTETRRVAGKAAEGVVFACSYVIPASPNEAYSAEEKAFLESFIHKYGTIPTGDVAYRAYDAVMILEEALLRADSLNGEDIRRAILSITNLVGIGGTFDFSDESGDGLKSCNVYRITDGEAELVRVHDSPAQ